MQRGANLTTNRTINGFNPLMLASAEGHVRVIKLLLAHGGDGIDDVEKAGGSTALYQSSIRGHVRGYQAVIGEKS